MSWWARLCAWWRGRKKPPGQPLTQKQLDELKDKLAKWDNDERRRRLIASQQTRVSRHAVARYRTRTAGSNPRSGRA